MKWTNRGHQLDAIAKQYLKVKNIFIWGAGKYGKRLINTLQWMKLDEDFSIRFVDKNASQYGKTHENAKIISPVQFFDRFNANTDVLVFCNESICSEVKACLGKELPESYFIAYAEHLPNHDFLRKFLSVYLMYKCEKLLSPHMGYTITTRCNLRCKSCLNFNEYIRYPADQTYEDFKKHIDIVFSKFDYLASFHFSGGDPLLAKDFCRCLEYISSVYGHRVFELFFATNGIIIPDKELLELMKKTRCGVLLGDYRNSVRKANETFPEVKRLLDKNGIWYNISKADYWYDLGISENRNAGSELSEEFLISHCDECNVHYFQDFFDGKLFGCCYIGYGSDMYSNKAHLYTPDPENDFISLADVSKMEILEYRFGYTNKGYYELCRRCSGMHGKSSVHIPVAEQFSRR